MRTRRLRFVLGVGATIAMALTLAMNKPSLGEDRDEMARPQRTSGVIARVGIEDYPVGCSGTGTATSRRPWTDASRRGNGCSTASQQDNVDGLMILVQWKTLQPHAYNEPLDTYYIDNAIYSLAHPERQHIHLAVLAGTHSPDWLITAASSAPFPDRLAGGFCNPSDGGPRSLSIPGKIWNTFYFSGLSSGDEAYAQSVWIEQLPLHGSGRPCLQTRARWPLRLPSGIALPSGLGSV